ncbi:PREDICTED: hypersensitive-induced response protein 1-like [Fragaria vesca subsp. vesca]|uniref:hypersensitive-induced response protein 1-like n=1 Tax=Fragaria vesca subsp. vesca TaxID=101020 RepID=UPI0002C319D6|nr:PREDICTED: hypersensitive-induced response protein 1-like [Fragaria vesca subsp. vesca]
MGQVISCIRVKQTKVAVKEHFGKFDGILQPGCHYVPWCLGYQVAGELSMRVQQHWITCESMTKDHVSVNVTTSVHFHPSETKVYDAFYKLKNTPLHIQSYVLSAITENVPKLELNAVFEEKIRIENAVHEALTEGMSTYGYEIVKTLVVDIVPSDSVKNALNENAAAKEKLGQITTARPMAVAT